MFTMGLKGSLCEIIFVICFRYSSRLEISPCFRSKLRSELEAQGAVDRAFVISAMISIFFSKVPKLKI